jgi:tRNA G18 (ribose-2'-O)-methylase SpoU
MPEYLIESLDDPRLDCYRDLKHAHARDRDVFIAEGDKLVLRLFDSPCRAESILCTKPARERLADRIPDGVAVYVTTTSVIARLVGFQFHRGVLAVGVPPAERTLQSILESEMTPGGQSLVAICPEIRDPANLGSIIRSAAAFGATCVIAGRAGTAPFSRRVLRTSMGAVLHVPIVQTDYWDCVIETLHRHDFETVATVLDASAETLLDAARPPRVAVLFGNEDSGLSVDLTSLCRRRVQVPMANQSISLNVSVAAGVVLHHFATVS